jgi:hypothetical protein
MMVEPVAPALAMPTEPVGPVLKIPLSDEKLELFRKEIERARQLRENKIVEWQVEENLKRYAPAAKNAVGVNVGVDFRDVERKGADLLFDTPVIAVQPGPDGDAQAALLHQELLNALLAADKMNAKATASKAIQNCLIAIQPAFTKIGYTPTIVDVPDAMTGLPIPQVVHEEFFWSRISGKAGLIPVDFHDTDYDKAPWLGYDWKKPVSQVKREYNLPPDWEPTKGGTREVTFSEGKEPAGASDPQCTGTELWYRASLFDDTVIHPELLRVLVLIDGYDHPVKHENAPWQERDGRIVLTPDTIIGYPIHPLALRDSPDSAWVPADSSQTGPLTKEINTYLDQTKAKRDANRLILLAAIGKIDMEALATIKEMEIFKGMDMNIIPVLEEALASGKSNTVLQQVPTLELGRETYLGLEIFEQKRDQILGMTAPQGGTQNRKARTATEIATVDRHSNARFNKERKRDEEWFLAGVRKFSAWLVQYGDRIAVDILGRSRAAQWLQFRQAGLLGRFTFDIAMDSGKYIDVEDDRRQFLQVINFAAKSPFINQQTMWRKFCEKFGYDPAEWLAQPQPEKPDPPGMNVALKGEDFIGAQGPIVLDLLSKMGYPIDGKAVQLALALQNLGVGAQPTNGAEAPANGNPQTASTADKADRLDQHQLDETGALSGPGPM